MAQGSDKQDNESCNHLWDIDSWEDILLSQKQDAFICGLKAECRNCGKVVEHHPITWTEVNRLVKEVYTPRVRWWR